MVFFGSFVPSDNPNLHNQTELSEISDEEFKFQWMPQQFTWYQRLFQFIYFFLFLGPIRIIIGLIGFIFFTGLVLIIRFFEKLFVKESNFIKKIGYFLTRIGFRFLIFCLGHVYIKLEGEIDPETRIFISNHTAYQDPNIISIIKYISPVCKAEIAKSIAYNVIDCSNPIYVRRDQPGGQSKSIESRAEDINSYPILLFPEGTLTRGDITLKFHRSAFLTNKKVQPLVIRYYMPFVPKNWNTYAWTDPNILKYFLSIISIPFNIVKVTALPSMTLEKDGNNNVEEFTKIAQLKIANFLGTKAVTRSSDEIFKKKFK